MQFQSSTGVEESFGTVIKSSGPGGSWSIQNSVFSLREIRVIPRISLTSEKKSKAAILIGAYSPRWFMKRAHVNPEEGVKIHQDIDSRYSVAIHWGTFAMADEPVDESPKLLEDALAQKGISNEHFFVMQHGETLSLQFLLR